MVRFVDVPAMTAWIREIGVEQIVRGLAAQLESDFCRWPEFEKIARIANHTPTGVVELMPISDDRRYAFKYVNGHPGNPARGLQTVTAFGVLADLDTGYPVLLSEMTLLTALRTAATSALVATRLARSDSRVMALIGTGSQAEFQALAFRALLGIEDLRIWDTDPAALDKFEGHARGLGFRVHRAADAADATSGADIITTCTADKALATVLTSAMVADGVHLNAIGGDCPGKTELDPAILRRAEIFVEYPPQTRIEGEIQQLAADHPVTELWRVFTGERPGRMDDALVTVFDSVGFAMEDLSALCFLERSLIERTAGTGHQHALDIIAAPTDPKDLFGLIGAEHVRGAEHRVALTSAR